jgi:hypothetical protein
VVVDESRTGESGALIQELATTDNVTFVAAIPEPAQWVSAVLPLTWFLDILRGVLLKGVGMRELWTQLGVLSGAALVLLVVSVRRFLQDVGLECRVARRSRRARTTTSSTVVASMTTHPLSFPTLVMTRVRFVHPRHVYPPPTPHVSLRGV